MTATTTDLATILGVPVARITDGTPELASGSPLTAAQQRAIQPLLDSGVPEVIDAAAVDFEATRRSHALISQRDRELLQTQALGAFAEALDALFAGESEPVAYTATKAHLALVAQAIAIEQAAATIKAGELPTDYLALVAAFGAALA